MTTRIKLKNSTVLDKAPTAADIDVGELALNCNAGSPAAYIQVSDGSIVQLAGAGTVPDATETVKGIAQIATTAQVTAGVDDTTIITPAKLQAASPALQDLQSVCNEGTTTSTGATFGSGTITLSSTGTINANGTVTANLFSGPLPYGDLTGTPTIPTNNNQLTNGAGYITSADGGDANQLDGHPGSYYLDYGNFTNTPTIPTDNNQLTNGAGYITIASVPTNNNQLTNGAGYYKSGDSPSFATVTATVYNLEALTPLP